mgnify:CR=1 FL=1
MASQVNYSASTGIWVGYSQETKATSYLKILENSKETGSDEKWSTMDDGHVGDGHWLKTVMSLVEIVIKINKIY